MNETRAFIDSTSSLHTALVDSRNSYEEALDEAEGKGLTGLFREMIALRSSDADEIGRILVALGEKPDDDGSFMTTVHRSVIKLRAMFSDLDERILPGLIDGEERILSYYDEALSAAGDSPAVPVLVEQRQRLQQKVAEMKSMSTAAG